MSWTTGRLGSGKHPYLRWWWSSLGLILVISINLFRARDIPKPPLPGESENSSETPSKRGVNIAPNVMFHKSVLERMNAPEARTASWRSLWRRKDIPYRPRAWPKDGEPEFVD